MAYHGIYRDAVNNIFLCVDKNYNGLMEGRLYHGYQKDGVFFTGYEKIIRVAEELFNALGYPFMGTNDRDINGRSYYHRRKKGVARILEDDELMEKHGDMGTFVVQVQHRQNSSWQGRVTYLEENKSAYFRSVLELIKMIDGALDDIECGNGAEDNKNKEEAVWQTKN